MKNKLNFKNTWPLILAAIFIILALLCGCGTKYKERRCRALNCCETVKDSTVYISTVKDSVIFIDESETWIDLLFQCDSANLVQLSKVARLETENSDLRFKYENNRLTVYVKSSDTVATVKNHTTYQYRDNVMVKYVNVLTKFQKTAITSGYVFWALIVIYLIYFVVKIVRKFI